SGELHDSEFVLYDPNHELCRTMLELGRKMKAALGSGMTLKAERNRRKALEGADFVFLSINVGGFKAHLQDIEIPRAYGILQSVGDTVGPGGVFRTLRFIPAVIDLCREMEQVCPKALLISYTNPMTSLIQAVSNYTKIRAVGMCHDYQKTVKDVEELLNDRFDFSYAGLNHCVWLLDIKKKGRSVYPALFSYIKKNRIPRHMLVKFDVLKNFGYMPAAGEKHVAEFFPYYLRKEVDYKKKWKLELRQDALKAMMKEREAEYRQIIRQVKGTEELKDIEVPSREEGIKVIECLLTGRSGVFNINMPNRGAIPNMPPDAVLETPVKVSASGFKTQCGEKIPENVYWNTLSHSIKLKMAVEAAVEGSRAKAFRALISDPACVDLSAAEKMLDRMIKLQPAFLGKLK
ncbi:MAG: hypothetical protein WCI43_02150, partial [Candidatus Firestonebacteria bacterium]